MALESPRIIRPVQQSLSLARATGEIAAAAMLGDLGHVAPYRPPAPDLPLVIKAAAAHKVATIPLKPAARIFVIDPPLRAPNGQCLRSIDAKEIQLRIMPLGA